MNILGLHFGHDASASVIRDGHIASCVLRERFCRIKHPLSLEFATILSAVQAAGLRLDQIDYCAITSTQTMELIIDDPARFSITFDRHPGDSIHSSVTNLWRTANLRPQQLARESVIPTLFSPSLSDAARQDTGYRTFADAFPEFRRYRQASEVPRFGWIDFYANSELWENFTLAQIGDADFSPLLQDPSFRFGFHCPLTVHLASRPIPACFIAHHAAHAASTYYQSPFNHAALFTHDGYGLGGPGDYLSGMFFLARDHRIFPLAPHYLVVAALYHVVGTALGLGGLPAPGKLMGLAAYGQPRFFDPSFIGNWFDPGTGGTNYANRWLQHCIDQARLLGYDLSPFADPTRITAPINVDIAASTQTLFEETSLRAASSLARTLARTPHPTENLCLSGGAALNCPSNSRLFRQGPFKHIFVEPGCDDSGLALGAALYLYHNLLDLPRSPDRSPATPFRGIPIRDDCIAHALQAAADRILAIPCSDAAVQAADDLAADRIIGWIEGPSEIGPRALGHRSILADPRPAANWSRVNLLKGREPWRPFAPAVLESHAHLWFKDLPLPSPYMLFTGQVLSDKVPAITHRDGSARVQTVNPSCGQFFRIIESFFARTAIPMVLNTSFNGPGEPIVETPAHALHFLLHTSLDALYMGGFRISRRS